MQLLRLSLQRSIFGYQQSLAMSTHYDVIVVGAGIFGSCAAYHSQKLGKKTLLLEQFARGHTNGSSHGKSRVTRYAHTQAAYVPLVDDAYKQIAELEKKRGEDLWKKTSLLWVATPEKVSSMNKILTEFGADHEVLPGSQISSRFPQFSYTDEVSALIDPMGGVLFADKWLNAFQDEFKKLGGTVHFEEEVEKLEDGSPAHVVTGKETYTADKLIVTVGSWVVKLFPNIGIKVQPQSIHVTYFKVKRPEDEQLLEIGSFPVFISSAIGNHPDVFGLPAVEYPHLIKFCSHHGEILDHGAPHNPGNVQEYIDIPSRYLADYLPVIDNNVQVVDKCKYTISEDHHYVIDKLPGSKNILLGACGSGSGFKVAPGIGRALAEMASGQKTTVDVSFFAIDRLFNISTEFNINSF